MEPKSSTFELHRGKHRETAEIRKVANGYIVCHYPVMGSSKEYIAETHKEAMEIVEHCLEKEVEMPEQDEKEPPTTGTNPGVYENKY